MEWMLDGVILLLALAGFAINLLLLVRRLTDFSLEIAGCGGGSSCEEILTSRWSQIFGIPVTVFGLVLYLVLMFSLTPRGQRLLAPVLGAVAGGAAWFIFAQAVLLGKFCPWCMTAHAVGAAVVLVGACRLGKSEGLRAALQQIAVWGASAFLMVGLVQLYGPLPTTHRIDAMVTPAVPETSGIHARGDGRKVSFADGSRTYNVSALPHLGAADAKHVLIEYFDYQCPACRTMRGYLAALIEKHPQDVCVVVLPVPLDGECNRSLGPLEAGHPGSCGDAKLALAVWKTNPSMFAEFHENAMQAASVGDVRHLAEKIIPPEKMDAALADPWIGELIQADIADWVSFSEKTKHLPKLLITGKRILHGLPSGQADFIRVMEQELGL